jgi:hypothetical protein
MHDPSLSYWPAIRDSGKLNDVMVDRASVKLWNIHFEGVYSQGVDTWDTGLFLTAIKENWLTIHPSVNLVSNIGAGNSSRVGQKNSSKKSSPWLNRPYGNIKWPLVHPITMIPNLKSEAFARKMHLGSRWKQMVRPLARCKWMLLGCVGIRRKG